MDFLILKKIPLFYGVKPEEFRLFCIVSPDRSGRFPKGK